MLCSSSNLYESYTFVCNAFHNIMKSFVRKYCITIFKPSINCLKDTQIKSNYYINFSKQVWNCFKCDAIEPNNCISFYKKCSKMWLVSNLKFNPFRTFLYIDADVKVDKIFTWNLAFFAFRAGFVLLDT